MAAGGFYHRPQGMLGASGGAPSPRGSATPAASAASHPTSWEGEAHCATAILARQAAAASGGPASFSRKSEYPYHKKHMGVPRRGAQLPYRPVPTQAVGFMPLGSWHKDGGKEAQRAHSETSSLSLTFCCWGMFRKRFNAAGDAVFSRGVRGILKELLIDEGVGPAGRLAVEVTFPFGVPSDAWLMRAKGNAAPSLILDLTLRLRGARCLEQAMRHADRIAQLLGDTTGVDSVDCAVTGKRDGPGEYGQFLLNAAKEEEEERAKKEVVARNRPKLTPTVDGKPISDDQAREREEKLARGEQVRAVKYEWRVPDEPLSQMGALLMAGSVADGDD